MTVDAELPAGSRHRRSRLAAWPARELPGTGWIIAVDQIAGGRSHLTYGITLDAGAFS